MSEYYRQRGEAKALRVKGEALVEKWANEHLAEDKGGAAYCEFIDGLDFDQYPEREAPVLARIYFNDFQQCTLDVTVSIKNAMIFNNKADPNAKVDLKRMLTKPVMQKFNLERRWQVKVSSVVATYLREKRGERTIEELENIAMNDVFYSRFPAHRVLEAVVKENSPERAAARDLLLNTSTLWNWRLCIINEIADEIKRLEESKKIK